LAMTRLILVSPEFADQSCELPDGAFRLGSSAENQIVLPDESVSAVHCELLVYGTEVIVRERGSQNGTYVHDVRVKVQRGVYHGQRLRFGNVEAVMRIEDPDASSMEGNTDITAIHDHCRRMRESAEHSTPATCFPVVFVRREIKAARGRAGAPVDEPATTKPAPVVEPERSDQSSGRERRFTLVIGILGLILLAVLLSGLLVTCNSS
jgi:predicted component of type VI protein secretion system